MQPKSSASQPVSNLQSWRSPERILAHWRSLIDVYFVGGGLVVAYMLGAWFCSALNDDWLLIVQMAWALLCCAAAVVVVISASVSTSPRARDTMQLSLAVFLMSLVTVFVYFVAYEALRYEFHLHYTCMGFGMWAILGIGVLCVEKRFAANIAITDPKPRSHWLVSLISTPLVVMFIGMCLVTAIDLAMGYRFVLGMPLPNFDSPFANTIIQWAVAALLAAVGVFFWLLLSVAHRSSLYPVDTFADMHPYQLNAFETIQVVAYLLGLLVFAVEGRFSFVVWGAVYVGVWFWVGNKFVALAKQKQAEKIAEGTRYIY